MPAIGSLPNSSYFAYATPADLLIYHDTRQIADTLKDDDTREASGNIATNPVVLAMLRTASAEVEAAVTTGNRYRPEDLLEMFDSAIIPENQGGDGILTGTVVGGELLKKLTCDLAFWNLCKRRRQGLRPEAVSGALEALDLLERLRIGERIFPIAETQDAGLPEAAPLTSDAQAIKRSKISMAERAPRFFGHRG
jgi:hypothetical protein